MIRSRSPSDTRPSVARKRAHAKTRSPACATSFDDHLVGAWMFSSAQLRLRDGGTIDLYGARPKGILVFTIDGYFVLMNTRPERSRFASGDSMRSTPQENEETVRGMVAYFGTYTVDPARKTFTIEIDGSSFPNYEGTRQERPFTLRGNMLTFLNPSPTVDGVEICATLTRAKPANPCSLSGKASHLVSGD